MRAVMGNDFFNDATLHKFIRKSTMKTPLRTLTEKEDLTRRKLSALKGDMKVCITELLTVRKVMKICSPESVYAQNSIGRIVNSLKKQRELIAATGAAFQRLRPDPKEAKAINYLFVSIKERLRFIRAVPLPGNIELTPIKEYLDIVGKTMPEDLRERFPNLKDMFAEGAVEEYAQEILRTVQKAGKENDYKLRLAMAEEAEKHRQELKRQEKLEEKEKLTGELHEASESYLFGFSKRLTECIERMIEDKRIGVCGKTVNRATTQKRGKYIVLEAHYSDREHKPYYRYLNGQGYAGTSYAGAKTFETEGEAKEAAEDVVRRDRRKAAMAFAVV